MLAVDTDVIVRFLLRDNEKQWAIATRLIHTEDIWITKTVLLETEWVLRSLYRHSPERIIQALRGLAGLPNVYFEHEDACTMALQWSAKGLDFADALQLASSREATKLATFGRTFAGQAQYLSAVEVIAL